MVVHHIAAFLLMVPWLFYAPFFVYDDCYFLIAMVLMEVSNAPMNLKDILRVLGLRFTRLFLLLEKMFFYSYLAARGIFAHTALFYPVSSAQDFHPVFRASMLVLWGMSIYNCYLVYLKVVQRQQEEAEMRSKGVELEWLSQTIADL